MAICIMCNSSVDDGDAFCVSCGATLSQPLTSNPNDTKLDEPQKLTNLNGARLVLPDSSEIQIDKSQRLIGRTDLIKFSQQEPSLISRGHFTIYEHNGKYYIQDGKTKVQDKESKNHTLLNSKDISGKERFELNNTDIIEVSDVKISVKLGNSIN